ncbi:hypothetical protein J4H86_14965 [Spiractinospora alimapuensis]|uniref:DUF7144 family membrane protein n=1 Tax=Spiractinospora alimapuensis TaxID=2820884 RepID=UPI001F40D74F|nr:hypothetical protein [Spiractinospora alimapuensis]QVQ50251.1 hypothetical protein J4H86_14965 [Spiractinospora alimapuensis]
MELRTANGWQFFAATMLLLAGAFHVVQGLVSWWQPEFFVVAEGNLFLFNFVVWGIVLVAWGVVVGLTGLACLTGQTWARAAGVTVAAISVLVQFAFMVAYPFWSILGIVVSLMVIYGLTAGWNRGRIDQGTTQEVGTAERAYRSGRRDAEGAPAPRVESEDIGDRTGRHQQSTG